MKNIFGAIVFLLLLLVGYLWWSGDISPLPAAPESPSSSPKEAPPSTSFSSSRKEKPPVAVPTPPPPPSPESAGSTPEENEEAKRAESATVVRQFVYDLRTLLVHIGRARAIAEGKYRGDTEGIPSLHTEMETLTRGYAGINTTLFKDSILSPLEELFGETEALIGTLSPTPTTQELREADNERGALQKKADALFLLLRAT